MSFANTSTMTKARPEIKRAVKKNKEREKTNMKLLSMTLTGSSSNEQLQDYMEFIVNIRELDVLSLSRSLVNRHPMNIFCGLWFNIKCEAELEENFITFYEPNGVSLIERFYD